MNERQTLLFLIYFFSFIFMSIVSLSFKLHAEDSSFHLTYSEIFMQPTKNIESNVDPVLSEKVLKIMVRDQVMEDQVLSLMEGYDHMIMHSQSSMPEHVHAWGKATVSFQDK